MLTMSHISKIRDLSNQGKSITEIIEETGFSYKTVRKYLDKDDFSEEIPTKEHKPSILDPYKAEIEKLLDNNKESWRKQKLTARRIYDLLKEKHGEVEFSYHTVNRYVNKYKKEINCGVMKRFDRLYWSPTEAQADFGEADFIVNNNEIKRYKYFVLSFPYSNKAFTQIYSGENCECVCQALINIFEHIGGVPTKIVFDNATGIGKRICNVLKENKIFELFRNHYHFSAKFTNPYSGYEKGNVESNVGYIRRNLFTPEIKLPRDVELYNKTKLFEVCEALMNKREHYIKKMPVNELFDESRNKLSDLPAKAFVARRVLKYKANGYNEIILEAKHVYTLSKLYRNEYVTVVTTAWKVDVYNIEGEFIESFERQYGNERTEIINLRTSINNVIKKPNSWGNSKLRKDLVNENKLIDYVDSLKKNSEISKVFNNLKESIDLYGFDTAIEASYHLIELKREMTKTNLLMYCQRLGTYNPYSCENVTNVDLNKYNILNGIENSIDKGTSYEIKNN
ncbi:MAG: IS21 family transposase [Spirochaetia bacterium]|nr:IS21 family transposase [Spirochaetia bacterium]